MKRYKYLGYGKKFEFDKIKNPVKKKREISVILPTYNEEGNIGRLCEEIINVMNSNGMKGKFEIVIIDDNSKDKTPEIMDKFAKKGNVVALHRYGIKGLFSAIQDGVRVANGKFILNMDSDLNHPPEDIPKLLKYKDDYGIVLCSRFVRGGKMPGGFVSRTGAFWINRIISLILGLNVRDINCGFHIMRKKDFEAIKFSNDIKFGEFDFELLYKSRRRGLSMKEVPFVLGVRDYGESNMGNKLKMSFNYFKKAFELRFG